MVKSNYVIKVLFLPQSKKNTKRQVSERAVLKEGILTFLTFTVE